MEPGPALPSSPPYEALSRAETVDTTPWWQEVKTAVPEPSVKSQNPATLLSLQMCFVGFTLEAQSWELYAVGFSRHFIPSV